MCNFSKVACFLFLLTVFSFESYGKIKLSLHLRDDLNSSEVQVSGLETYPLTDSVAEAFSIPRQIVGKDSHKKLWDVIENKWGKIPNEFVTSDPVIDSSVKNVPRVWMPYKDFWGEENQVKVERKAVDAIIIESTGSVNNVAANNVKLTSYEQQAQDVKLSYIEKVQDGHYSEKIWTMSLSNEIELNVGGEYMGVSTRAPQKFKFTIEQEGRSKKLHTTTKGKTVRLKTNVNEDTMTIYPESEKLKILKIKIDYEYRLTGSWRAIYIGTIYRKSYTSPPSDITELLEAMRRPTTIRNSEILEIGFVIPD